jgi:hypothetical protein
MVVAQNRNSHAQPDGTIGHVVKMSLRNVVITQGDAR